MPHRAAVASTPTDQQAPCHREKPNKIRVFCTPNGHPSPAIDAAAAEFSAHRRAPGAARSTWVRAPRGRARVVSGMQGTNSAAKTRRQIKIEGTVFREKKSGRSIVIFDWRDTGGLRRENALVYRAGLLNETGCPVGGRFRDELYDFAHLLTEAGSSEEKFRQ
jgi:hypothetical protein